jgi:hypothetical protein
MDVLSAGIFAGSRFDLKVSIHPSGSVLTINSSRGHAQASFNLLAVAGSGVKTVMIGKYSNTSLQIQLSTNHGVDRNTHLNCLECECAGIPLLLQLSRALQSCDRTLQGPCLPTGAAWENRLPYIKDINQTVDHVFSIDGVTFGRCRIANSSAYILER